jgi:hypothetical protein
MLLLMPLYHRLAGMSFSHAYFGATRHAITVGFVSLMIMGMAAKVVPTLNGVDPRTLGSLRGPFLLLNAGCLLRVLMQIGTDWTTSVYPPLGLSGTLEVTGLAWWGIGLIVLMLRGQRAEPESAQSALPVPRRIEPHHRVGDVLEWFPLTENVFLRHGFKAIQNPALRRTVAREVTVAQAARLRGVDPASLLLDLNETVRVAAIELPLAGGEARGEEPEGSPARADVRLETVAALSLNR